MALTKVTSVMTEGFPRVYNVKSYGAAGDASSDDTSEIQSAIDAATTDGGGIVYFPPGTYRIARTVGTNDSYGLKITGNNITLRGDDAYLRRYDTDISTDAKAYAILFVGTPDSNSADATENITIDTLNFIGEDTRHSGPGQSPSDKRNCIEFKNTNKTSIQNCEFTKIDSAAIFYQRPANYDYANSTYYNTTKNYNGKILNSRFFAESHTTPGRALIHALGCGGIDKIIIDNNYFEWCDVVLDGEGTYGWLNQTETTTWTPTYAGWTLGAVKRVGRDWVFSNNIVINSSEHAVYAAGMNVTVTGNTFRAENSTYCIGDIKLRSIGASISGNSIVSGQNGSCISISEPSYHVSVTGNICYSDSTEVEGGAISVDANGLTSYIDNRVWLSGYQAMENITITGNSIRLPSSTSSLLKHIGIRVYVSNSDANFPEGQVRNLIVSGNDVKNHRHGVYIIGVLLRNVVIEGNNFDAKPYTSSGFASGTTMNTYSTLLINSSATSAAQNITFRDNTVSGSDYLFATHDGSGSSVDIPWGITNNYLYAIKNFKTSDMRAPVQNNAFRDNTGYNFLDRTGWIGAHSLNNSLGTSASSNTELKYNLAYNGTNIIFYTDDSGTTITL